MSSSDHPNGKVIVKTGYHIELTVPVPKGRGRQNGYWKYGIVLDVKRWLDSHAGDTCGQHVWELENRGDWLHTGVTQNLSKSKGGNDKCKAHFWFRDRRIAMLFVLAWKGKL